MDCYRSDTLRGSQEMDAGRPKVRLTVIPNKAASGVSIAVESADAIAIADSCVVHALLDKGHQAGLQQVLELLHDDDEGGADEEADVQIV